MVFEEPVMDTLVGVRLADDHEKEKDLALLENKTVILGAVMLPYRSGMSIEDLKSYMQSQLVTLPPSFVILTKEGWPVHTKQEKIVKASHVLNSDFTVTIRRHFENPRVGIVTTQGDYLGFIFIQYNWSLSQVREAFDNQVALACVSIQFSINWMEHVGIVRGTSATEDTSQVFESLVKALAPPSNQLSSTKNRLKDLDKFRKTYIFVERNNWPVAPVQEHILTVLDVLFNHHICIEYKEKLSNQHEPLHHIKSHDNVTAPSGLSIISTNRNSGQDQDTIDGGTKIHRLQSSVRKGKDLEKKQRLKNVFSNTSHKQKIFISYVRAEAFQYALVLKQGLCNLGFNVYLDVHEIKTGSDWQDALNYAVSNCPIFVPLITSTYGKSRWTNREVKLADVLGKFIVPVNFLDHWPPECLAIQFATTQYVLAKSSDEDAVKIDKRNEKCDPRAWNPVCVKRVSKEISERSKALSGKCELMETMTMARDMSLRVYAEDRDANEKQLIVISAHPKQKAMCQELKTVFEELKYKVWCSVDLQEYQDQVFTDTVDSFTGEAKTPKELPPIPEGETVFSQAYKDIASSIEESKRTYYFSKAEIANIERRQLNRLASTTSEISQISSLTVEKMEQLKKFQQKADLAKVVIIIVSEAYTKSKTSHQQVFYCEHRKPIVLVKCDETKIPSWFAMLVGNDMITNVSNPQFITTLKARVKRALNPASSTAPKDATTEAKMQYYINFVKKSVPQLNTCVYIAGSSKLANKHSEEICIAIGQELAKIENITLITGGCFGVQEIVAKSFYEARENNKELTQPSENPIIHIIATKDTQDYSAKTRQNPDGTFEPVPFGQSIFLGESIKEREAIVARLFDTCIVIEGGTGAAHEVEEFIWNDHFVIPIISTSGAAGGHYGVPLKILETPPSVSESDWSVLSEKEASPEEVAKAVLNIVLALKKSVVPLPHSQPPRIKSRKSRKAKNRKETNAVNATKVEPTVNAQLETKAGKEKLTRWQKFLKNFSAVRAMS